MGGKSKEVGTLGWLRYDPGTSAEPIFGSSASSDPEGRAIFIIIGALKDHLVRLSLLLHPQPHHPLICKTPYNMNGNTHLQNAIAKKENGIGFWLT